MIARVRATCNAMNINGRILKRISAQKSRLQWTSGGGGGGGGGGEAHKSFKGNWMPNFSFHCETFWVKSFCWYVKKFWEKHLLFLPRWNSIHQIKYALKRHSYGDNKVTAVLNGTNVRLVLPHQAKATTLNEMRLPPVPPLFVTLCFLQNQGRRGPECVTWPESITSLFYSLCVCWKHGLRRRRPDYQQIYEYFLRVAEGQLPT